jgi:hypothetical protein
MWDDTVVGYLGRDSLDSLVDCRTNNTPLSFEVIE